MAGTRAARGKLKVHKNAENELLLVSPSTLGKKGALGESRNPGEE